MRPQTAALLAIVGIAAGCSGDETTPLAEAPPATARRTDISAHPLVRDAAAIRRAAESGTADNAIDGIYVLLRRAAEEEPAAGAARVEAELPPLVDQLVSARPTDRARIRAARVTTEGGRQLRSIAVLILDKQVASFRLLETDVDRASRTWDAVVRWGERNDRIKEEHDRRFLAVFKGLPPQDQATLEQAVKEVYAP